MYKVLIIEDDPIVARIYGSRFEKEGFQSVVATNGESGFECVQDLHPDIVLLDLMLPKMNGIEVLKKLRALPELNQLPVLVFTNAYVGQMIDAAFQAGATSVYNKSNTTPRDILDAIQMLLTGDTAPAPETHHAPSSPPEPPEPPAENAACRDEALQNILSSGTAWISEMRRALQEVSKAPEGLLREAQLEEFHKRIRAFSCNSGLAGLDGAAQLAKATDALVLEFLDKPRNITPSALRTAAHAIDCLGDLTRQELPPALLNPAPVRILVVDDEALSRRAIACALDKAHLEPLVVESAEAALRQTQDTAFDLILLDVQMPGMDGFELCSTLRASGINTATPIVFVTSGADFMARAKSTLKGGSDMIAKPFIFIELVVKALTFVLRHRLEQSRHGPSATPVPEVVGA